MATVFDTAKYILSKMNPISAMKLQKLCFYSQAWSLVWDDKPIFNEHFEAWSNGPVCSALYKKHARMFQVGLDDIKGNIDALSDDEKETIDVIMSDYGKKSPYYLSTLTHKEKPWKDARGNLGPSDIGDEEITHASMAEYYGSLTTD